MEFHKLKGSNKRNSLCKLSVIGEMTIYDALEMRDKALELIGDCKRLELDLNQVEGIDTAGVQVLIGLDKCMQEREGSLKVLATNDTVRELLSLYRLDSYIPESTEDELAGAA